jgi:CheY-like chemotaxis protein
LGAGPEETRKAVILLVEDDPLVSLITAEILQDAGFDVLEAVDASEALALLNTGRPLDLVITDIRMPGQMDGVQLAGIVKNSWPGLPVALLSSHLERRQHEADLFIPKPFDPDRLVEAVRRLLAARIAPEAVSPNAT